MYKLCSELQRCPDKALPLFLCLMSMGSSASFLPSPLQESALAAARVISILQLAARSAGSPSLRGLGLDPGRAARAPAAEHQGFILTSPIISPEIKSGEKLGTSGSSLLAAWARVRALCPSLIPSLSRGLQGGLKPDACF